LGQLGPGLVQIIRVDIFRTFETFDCGLDLTATPADVSDVPTREEVNILSAAFVVEIASFRPGGLPKNL
jgi:hypothetical protein